MYNEQSKFEQETILSVLEYAGDIEENEIAEMLEDIVEQFPNDIFTLKLCHILVSLISPSFLPTFPFLSYPSFTMPTYTIF